MHLVIDGFGCDYSQAGDPEYVRKFLDSFPESIEMTKISSPLVTVYHGKHAEDWGVSGFVIIAESHISVHTFPDRSHINIDVFSCKEFDAQRASEEITNYFQLERIRSWVLPRGREHLDPETAEVVVANEREALRHRL